ncbi:Endomucin [Fukomys damarensis]|uniref:Endomucin n=1 Tax=Fukomys damarensis TaxID=885580 RepID=A0A091E3L3_FUKDA|nr:Endomucin [Fukomys damarensis]
MSFAFYFRMLAVDHEELVQSEAWIVLCQSCWSEFSDFEWQQPNTGAGIILPVVIVLIVITLSVFVLVGLYRMCWKNDPGTPENGSDQPQSDKESVKLLTVKTLSHESGGQVLSLSASQSLPCSLELLLLGKLSTGRHAGWYSCATLRSWAPWALTSLTKWPLLLPGMEWVREQLAAHCSQPQLALEEPGSVLMKKLPVTCKPELLAH